MPRKVEIQKKIENKNKKREEWRNWRRKANIQVLENCKIYTQFARIVERNKCWVRAMIIILMIIIAIIIIIIMIIIIIILIIKMIITKTIYNIHKE